MRTATFAKRKYAHTAALFVLGSGSAQDVDDSVAAAFAATRHENGDAVNTAQPLARNRPHARLVECRPGGAAVSTSASPGTSSNVLLGVMHAVCDNRLWSPEMDEKWIARGYSAKVGQKPIRPRKAEFPFAMATHDGGE
jgi:hypothetical protein